MIKETFFYLIIIRYYAIFYEANYFNYKLKSASSNHHNISSREQNKIFVSTKI